MKVEGEDILGRWYFHGPYKIAVGRPYKVKGNVENRRKVRSLSEIVFKQIISLAEDCQLKINDDYLRNNLLLPQLFGLGFKTAKAVRYIFN
jgi:hypothetical protein